MVFPLFALGQESSVVFKNEIKNAVKSEVAIKKVDPISANPTEQSKTLNTLKSKELISIRAYIKTLRLKRKETVLG